MKNLEYFMGLNYKIEIIKDEAEAIVEDAEDFEAFEERVGEPLVSYDDMIKRLKENGRI